MSKNTECKSYTIASLRSAVKSFNEIEAEIHALIVANAKDLIDGKSIDVSDLAGSYRAYEMITERYEKAEQAYETHQERCGCSMPEDFEAIF